MKKILVAETLKTFIADSGVPSRNNIVISYASTTEKILSSHRANAANLIIVDLDTPELGGEGLCQLIRKENNLRKVSIIIVCDPSKDLAERCIASGANAVVLKPVRSEDLLAKITKLLNIRERKSVREIIKVSVTVNSTGSLFFAVAKNLSISGLLFETNRVIPKGARVSCSFVLQHPVVVNGEISRITQKSGKSGDVFEYGVRFHGLDPLGKAEIEAYFKNTGRKI